MYYIVINTNRTNNPDKVSDIQIVSLNEESQRTAEGVMAFYAVQNNDHLAFGTDGKVDEDITDSDQLLDLDNNLEVCWEKGDERISIYNGEIRYDLLNGDTLDQESNVVVQAFAEQIGAEDEIALKMAAHIIAEIYSEENLTTVMDAKVIPVKDGFLLYSTGEGELNEVWAYEYQCIREIRGYWENLDVDLLSDEDKEERREALSQLESL